MESESESSDPGYAINTDNLRALFTEYLETLHEIHKVHRDTPYDHNPHPADRRPAALDFTRGVMAADAFDMIAATAPPPTDGMWDLPTPPVSVPGEWTVPARDDFAAVYAAVDPGNDDTGEWGSYKACRADGFGGYWTVDAPPIDHAFARPIVEAAMRGMGMNVPFRSIIKRLRRGGTGG